jgi:hypothetical protein
MSEAVGLGRRLAVLAMVAAACTGPNPRYELGDLGAGPGADAATGGSGGAGPGLDAATGGMGGAGPGRDGPAGGAGGGGADADDARSSVDAGPGEADAQGGGGATLVGHWAIDEGSGATVADRRGANDATFTGGVTWLQPGAPIPSSNPACLLFDGLDDEGQANVTDLAGLDQAFSLAIWVWSPQPSGNPRKTILTLLRPLSSGGTGVQLGLEGLTPALWYYGDDGVTNTLVFPSTITAQAWHHLVYVHENSRHTLYVDGVMMASATRPPPSSETPTRLRIATYGGTSQHFPGRLDDLRLYRGALTSAEAAALVTTPP